MLAAELPSLASKKLMRAALDLAVPNPLIDIVLALPPMRWIAQHVYFHRRGAKGVSFAEFEAKLRNGTIERYPSFSPGA